MQNYAFIALVYNKIFDMSKLVINHTMSLQIVPSQHQIMEDDALIFGLPLAFIVCKSWGESHPLIVQC